MIRNTMGQTFLLRRGFFLHQQAEDLGKKKAQENNGKAR